MERARDIEREKNAEKELKTVCSKEIKPPATINFFFSSDCMFLLLLFLLLRVSRVVHKNPMVSLLPWMFFLLSFLCDFVSRFLVPHSVRFSFFFA